MKKFIYVFPFALLFALNASPVLSQSRTNTNASNSTYSLEDFDRMFTHRRANVNGIQLHYVTVHLTLGSSGMDEQQR